MEFWHMESALEARGTTVGVPADSLERPAKGQKEVLKCGDLCLITPYSPNAGFAVGAAMGRNRLIYCLADHGHRGSVRRGNGRHVGGRDGDAQE